MNSSQALATPDWQPVAANSNEAGTDARAALPPAALAAQEAVLAAAVLVATAFRLRDEAGLVATLRRLADAVDAWEKGTS